MPCIAGTDCASNVCKNDTCEPSLCSDGVKNGAETGIDCGGGTCLPCAVGEPCAAAGDCSTGVCFGGLCKAAACDDYVKNGGETAVDCGGPSCPACSAGQGCQAMTDCESGVCKNQVCQAPACDDGVKNGDESALDCGGSCPPCSLGSPCVVSADCNKGVCEAGQCRYPRTCSELHQGQPQLGDGLYSIDVDKAGAEPPFLVYCDMSILDGGWTLVLLNSPYPTPPKPSWAQVVGQVNVTGNLQGGLSAFDLFLGVKYWNLLGTMLRVEAGDSSTSLEHLAVFTFSLDASNYYALNLANPQVLLGSITPGIYGYHNGRPLSTHDADHDAHTTACAPMYGNTAWWYGACWSGSYWGGGDGGSYTNNPYWTSSGTDYHPWGAIWVK
jgi:hypothetical protein